MWCSVAAGWMRARMYRRLPDVLAAQGGTIEVLHVLRPLIVVMAGADDSDPTKGRLIVRPSVTARRDT